jgi:2-hydroxycyclohexanecarboxyl-CoA dehydrogenase
MAFGMAVTKMRGLKDKPVIVTGGASGIGRAIAVRLAAEGSIVGIFDINGEAAEAAASALRESGARAFGYKVDIVDYDAVARAVDAFEAAAGPIGGLVNNAGWDKAVRFVETDRALWQKVIDINLWGPLNVTHVVLKKMVEHGKGHIVSMASDAGRVGSSGEAVYSACKGGIAAFAKTVAREVARQGIVVNTICPGPTDTPLFATVSESAAGLAEALKKAIPLRRLGKPDDYPGLVCFLLSDDASFITGQTISVSGGLTMHG